MIESPLIDELVMEKYGAQLAEKTREATREATRQTARRTAQRGIRIVLETRFGDVPGDLLDDIQSVDREEQLQTLMRTAVVCPDLEAFRTAIAQN